MSLILLKGKKEEEMTKGERVTDSNKYIIILLVVASNGFLFVLRSKCRGINRKEKKQDDG